MEITAKVANWFAILLGFFTFMAGLPTYEYYADTDAIVGGVMFMAFGIINLINISYLAKEQ